MTMKREKFVQDAKGEPERYYRNPTDILRDRRLTDTDRMGILEAWERREETVEPSEPLSPASDETRLDQIRRVRREVEDSGKAISQPSMFDGQ